MDGQKVRPDPTVHARNEAKRHFCSKYDGYEDFCDGKFHHCDMANCGFDQFFAVVESHLDDQLTPAPIYNKSLADSPIFRVPILVVAGKNKLPRAYIFVLYN